MALSLWFCYFACGYNLLKLEAIDMDNGFVGNIEYNFYVSINENAFEKLFREYERVIFRSIITSFGLDLFIKDRYGGDVDTIINVRKIDTDSQLSYKNQANAIDYDSRGNYTHKGVEGTGTKFQEKKHEAKKHYDEDNSNTIHDVYTGGELHFLRNNKNHPTDLSAELDHVISAKTIHDDRGRVLSGCSTVDLADRENNLKWTNEHLNKSMRANEIPEYISKHPELPEDTKKRMMDAYNQSKAEYEEQIERKYYFNC